MPESIAAKALLDELESICSDAWNGAPNSEQSKELWRAIWDGDDTRPCVVLGDSLVVLPTLLHVRALAESSNRWWLWTVAGDPFAVTLAGAQAMFREDVPEMSAEAAAEYLRQLSASLDDVGKRAVGKAIAALKRG